MHHGQKAFQILAPRSTFHQGPYGRIFPELPPWSPLGISHDMLDNRIDEVKQFFIDLTNDSMQDPVATQEDLGSEAHSSDIPAGYTYFGQFVDHDITFDPTSSLMRANDPHGIINHRTPGLDLDCLYGSGPNRSPYLYQKNDPNKFIVDTCDDISLPDLPRNREAVALIGDPRNDENAIVAQVHLAFLLAHNKLVDLAIEEGFSDPFEQARKSLRWLYQYIVWHDFIARFTVQKIHEKALTLNTSGQINRWELGFPHVYRWKKQPFMPIEFSIAAYRFGHTLVRNQYLTNKRFTTIFSQTEFTPLFVQGSNVQDLRGGHVLNKQKYLQWDWFLPMESTQFEGTNLTVLPSRETINVKFPQKTRKLDPKLSQALFQLPGQSDKRSENLAYRNLLRGLRFGLPAGTDVAHRLGLDPIFIERDLDSLWYYVLKEAEVQEEGNKLGQVGSIIVCATFAGLLMGDQSSYVNMHPTWTPDKDPLLSKVKEDNTDGWTLATIIRLSELPVSSRDFSEL